MVPLGLLERFVVARRSSDAERLLFSTRLVRVVRVVLVGYGNFVKPGIVCPSTRVRTTRCSQVLLVCHFRQVFFRDTRF
jgi:hypothetical protein